MDDDFWEGLSVERAFSAHLCRPSAEDTLERLVIGNVGESMDQSNFPINKTINRPSSPQIVVDSSKKRKLGKKVKFAKDETVISPTDAKNAQTSKDNDDDEKLLTLDDAFFDVRKFSITGYKGEEREEAKVNLAVKLGAKRAKAKCVNYDQLKEQRKQRKAERLERKQTMRKDIGLRKTKGGKIKKSSRNKRSK